MPIASQPLHEAPRLTRLPFAGAFEDRCSCHTHRTLDTMVKRTTPGASLLNGNSQHLPFRDDIFLTYARPGPDRVNSVHTVTPKSLRLLRRIQPPHPTFYVAPEADSHNSAPCEQKSSRIILKKSGEIVKSVLRPRKHAISSPPTPTFKKVHFDVQLERVKYFFRFEKPAAISEESSATFEDSFPSAFPFEKPHDKYRMEVSPFTSFPESPVRMERIDPLSNSHILRGHILVKNIAYDKNVAVRFTFDNWKTISERSAYYNDRENDGTIPKEDGMDRFTFILTLQDFVNIDLMHQSMTFCIRYNVANQEFWDNNSGTNFLIDFHKQSSEVKPPKSSRYCPRMLNTVLYLSQYELLDDLENISDIEDDELWKSFISRHALTPQLNLSTGSFRRNLRVS